MLTFLANIRNYLIIGVIAALAVGCGISYIGWTNANAEVTRVSGELKTAKESLETSEKTVEELKKDVEWRSDLNLELGIEIIDLKDTYATDTKDLNRTIDLLRKRQPQATTTINSKEYVEVQFVDEVSSAVLDSMWVTYCKVNHCPEPLVQ